MSELVHRTHDEAGNEYGKLKPTPLKLNVDTNSFVKVKTLDGKWIELYWVANKLELRGNADVTEAARFFFDKVTEYANALRAEADAKPQPNPQEGTK